MYKWYIFNEKLFRKNLNYNNIKILTDYTNDKPTTANIYKELYNLLVDSIVNNIEEVWIHYSGHGTSIIDYSGDEKDGRMNV